MDCIFTVDVEDWFHILDTPDTPAIEAWDRLPSRVEANFHKLLDMFARYDVRMTCFFLGWVAERFPQLVRAADRLGHEIASHGHAHRLTYRMSPEEFLQDIRRSKEVLEDITGNPVWGYRSPGFSVTLRTPWFFDKVAEAGYRYDSSVFPARRSHGGMPNASQVPYKIITASGTELAEFPMSTVSVLGGRMQLFGGGYLRLYPWWLIQRAAHRVLDESRPLIFYIHPREIDPQQPRLRMNPMRMFKSYVNIETTEQKLENILKEFEVTTFRQLYASNWTELEAPRKPAVTAAAGSAGAVRVG